MMLALMQQKQYEKTGEVKHFNNAIATLTTMQELNRGDARTKDILRQLQVLWYQKNPDAKPDAPK
jgi:hypothetical protein